MDNNIVNNSKRRFDIDHLRVYAFGLLILYHTGMLYVAGWGFHIKSHYQSDLLANVMLLVNPWRMPLIWMISGIASYFLLRKLSYTNFLVSRSIRILLPLLFGILFVVPPQLYFEMKFNGDIELTFWQFWQVFFDLDNKVFDKYTSGIFPHIDVNHLWYLRALWAFTLILALIQQILNHSLVTKIVAKSSCVLGRFSILIVPIFIFFILHWLFINQLEGDRVRQALGFIFFILGYLIANQESWWIAMKQIRKIALRLAIISYLLLIYRYNAYYLNDNAEVTQVMKMVFSLAYIANQWLWLVCIFGYANEYLNKKNKVIQYLNPAVYPIYILHQTFIIALGFLLGQLKLGVQLEATLVLIGTIILCIICYEVIKRIPILKVCFGMSMEVSHSTSTSVQRFIFNPLFYRSIGLLIILPIALPIFTWFFGLNI